MNLVKWFRKNNKKVMAIFVIVIMISFVAGPAIQQLQRAAGPNRVVAYFAEDTPVTEYDLYLARRDLEILRALQADILLRSWGSQDLQVILLSEVLFSESARSGAMINYIKRTIRTNQLRISNKQINEIYSPKINWAGAPNVYWYCLQNEAALAGFRVSNDNAGQVLGMVIPQLFNGATYSQLIDSMMKRHQISEQQILTTFGKLLAVLQHCHMTCSNQDVTIAQAMHTVSTEQEVMDIEFVRFDSADFVARGTDAESQAANHAEHFDKYKRFFAGAISDENPYGFGYKLPDRIRLEYVAVKLDDVRAVVAPATQDEMTDYYDRNKGQLFTEQVPSDPNDPNSPMTEQTKRYAEVAAIISKRLFKDKTESTAQTILQEAKRLASEQSDIGPATDSNSVPPETASGWYGPAAEQLSEKYNVKVYAGRTGLLSPIDMQGDEYLSRLYFRSLGSGGTVALPQVLFAIDELGTSELGPSDVPKPEMYEDIGPVKDMFERIMVVVRAIEAQKTAEPQSIDQTFSTSSLNLDPNEQGPGQESQSEDIYSVRERVAEDLEKLAAISATKSKAEEFVDLVATDGWDSALAKFNELYAQEPGQDSLNSSDPNVLRLANLTNLQRISRATLGTLAVLSQGDPAAELFLNEPKRQRLFVDQLYSLVPPDSNSVEVLPLVMEFKPDMSYYVIKDISIKRVSQQEYQKIKPQLLYREDYVQSQSLAAVHLSPANILKRMNFRLAETNEEPADANAQRQSGATP